MDHDHETTTSGGSTTPLPEGVCIPKMDMSLHWGTCEWILVRTWKADTTGKFVFAFFVIFFSAILYEALKQYREVLFYHTQKAKEIIIKQTDGSYVRSSPKLSVKEYLFNIPHGLQTTLHGLQVFISYILMLVVMLCNMYLIIAVCLGAAIGYFAFGWLRKKSSCNNDMGECCY